MIQPSENDAFANAVDIAAQWVRIDVGQHAVRVRSWTVLELTRRDLRQHQSLNNEPRHSSRFSGQQQIEFNALADTRCRKKSSEMTIKTPQGQTLKLVSHLLWTPENSECK